MPISPWHYFVVGSSCTSRSGHGAYDAFSITSSNDKRCIFWTHPFFSRHGRKTTYGADRLSCVEKRMFATYLEKDNSANIFLTPEEQKLFCKMSPDIFPVPNKWGEKGATTFMLDKVNREIVAEALLSAYNEVLRAKKKWLPANPYGIEPGLPAMEKPLIKRKEPDTHWRQFNFPGFNFLPV